MANKSLTPVEKIDRSILYVSVNRPGERRCNRKLRPLRQT